MTDEPEAGKATESLNKDKGATKKPKRKKTGAKQRRVGKTGSAGGENTAASSKYPRHSIAKALRIPRAILDQNAGKSCGDQEALRFSGLSYNGPNRVELSSALKYGLLERIGTGTVEVTDLAKRILRPQKPTDAIDGMRLAVLMAPTVSDVYTHYRGENVPDEEFFRNALVDTFGLPKDKVDEFKAIFFDDLTDAQLIEDVAGKKRILDISNATPELRAQPDETLKKISKGVKIVEGDTCFVMMPFADPIGGYYKSIYETAISKAGLRPIRADDEIFGTGKIIDQVWSGISAAKVLVAELTGRNPNVFYELGLAHALEKPVVLVSSNPQDVPFDLQHIRVIYYDMRDPFWGDKLIAKVSENVISALKNPGEALLKRPGN
jgi:hypothetical protein